LILGLTNSLGSRGAQLNPQTRLLYLLGSTFTLGHFIFGPTAMRVIAELCVVEYTPSPCTHADLVGILTGKAKRSQAREMKRQWRIGWWCIEGERGVLMCRVSCCLLQRWRVLLRRDWLWRSRTACDRWLGAGWGGWTFRKCIWGLRTEEREIIWCKRTVERAGREWDSVILANTKKSIHEVETTVNYINSINNFHV